MPGPSRSTGSATREYRKLMTALTSRAARLGAADPEGAAQETVKRSLANPQSRAALEYYVCDDGPPSDSGALEWSLLQLFGWLHGVLRNVVLEERHRGHREDPPADGMLPDHADPSPDPLARVIDDQIRSIVREALGSLNVDHRAALRLRLDGLKYSEIAERLGVNENTVATWVRRGSRALIEAVHQRTTTEQRSELLARLEMGTVSRG